MREDAFEQLAVLAELAGTRLDTFLSMQTELSRSAAAKLIENGSVLVNGAVQNKRYAIKETDQIAYFLPEPLPSKLFNSESPGSRRTGAFVLFWAISAPCARQAS